MHYVYMYVIAISPQAKRRLARRLTLDFTLDLTTTAWNDFGRPQKWSQHVGLQSDHIGLQLHVSFLDDFPWARGVVYIVDFTRLFSMWVTTLISWTTKSSNCSWSHLIVCGILRDDFMFVYSRVISVSESDGCSGNIRGMWRPPFSECYVELQAGVCDVFVANLPVDVFEAL